MPRKRDMITVEAEDGGIFDKFESLRITNDILNVTEAQFEIGDDGAFAELAESIEIGNEFTVKLNGHPRMVGRAEVQSIPGEVGRGVNVALTLRTKMSDARYSSADPSIKVEKVSIKDFILACYAPLGFTEADFVFGDFSARDLITGKANGFKDPIDFEPIKVDQAKVKPPETIFQAVERHLKRYGATQWDAPDGKIYIGTPDDTQDPLYRLLCRRGADSAGNNIVRFRKLRDFTDVAEFVEVFGGTPGKTTAKTSLVSRATADDVEEIAAATGNFNRRVLIPSQKGKTQSQNDRLALRELSMRSRRKDVWEFSVDGWTYWNGDEQIPWANNTTVDVDVEMAGGPAGRYLIIRVDLDMTLQGSVETKISCVAPGIWVL